MKNYLTSINILIFPCMVKVRNSSFELLRLMLMLMIVVHHFIVHGLGLAQFSGWSTYSLIVPPGQMWIAFGMNAFLICAVNCFILISGFFKIDVTLSRFVNLILSILFYTVLLTIIPYIVMGDWKIAILKTLFLSHSQYWFVIDYLFLMVFAPMLNLAYDNFSERQRHLMTIGLLIISCYFGFIWKHAANSNGYTLLQFITLYCLGRDIAKSGFQISKLRSISLYIFGSLVVGMGGLILWYKGYDSLAWKTTFYNDPFLVISSIGLFMFFKNFTFHSGLINRLSKSAFGIYLFQSSALIGFIAYGWLQEQNMFEGGIIWFVIILLSILTAFVSIFFDQIRIIFLKFFTPTLINVFQKWK